MICGTPPTTARPTLRGDIAGGLLAAVVVTPTVLGCGAVLFQPLGPSHAGAGIAAAFVGAILAGTVAGVVRRGPLLLASPKTALAAILAALIASLAGRPALADAPPAALMAAVFLCIILAGLVQLLLGTARLGRLVKFVPFPVVAGFTTGIALLIVTAQVPRLVGLETLDQVARALTGAAPFPAGAAVVAALTVAATLAAGRWLRRLPRALVGLVVGGGAYHAATLAGAGAGAGEIGLGPTVEPFAATVPAIEVGPTLAVLAAAGWPALTQILIPIGATAVTLAVVMSLDTVLGAAAVDGEHGVRSDAGRTLAAHGLGNALAGLLGGLAVAGSLPHSRTAVEGGARTGWAAAANGAGLAAVAAGLSLAGGVLPLPVLSAVVVVLAFGLIDGWTRALPRRLAAARPAGENRALWADAAVVVAVAGLVVFAGVLPAVGAGLIVSFFVFLGRSAGSVVRDVQFGDRLRSKTARPLAATEALRERGGAIAVFALQGPLFFGSADRLAAEVEAVRRRVATVILEMRRVSDVDATGAVVLRRLAAVLARDDKTLILAGLPAGGALRGRLDVLGLDGLEADGRVFGHLDDALSWAEDRLLGTAAGGGDDDDGGAEATLATHDLAHGLDAAGVAALEAVLAEAGYPAGARIFAEGEAGDTVLLIAAGRASVRKGLRGGGSVRLAGFMPGTVVGEMALASCLPRSADVMADTAVRGWVLSRAAFDRLAETHPAVAIVVLRNVARELAKRLRDTSETVSELEK